MSPDDSIAEGAVTTVDGVWVHRARVQLAEQGAISDTDQVLARGLAAAERHVALIGYQLVALGGSVPPSPEKASEFGRFVAVELAEAYVEGSTAQLADFTEDMRRQHDMMEELTARSRQETTDLKRLTEEIRRDQAEARRAAEETDRNRSALDDLLARITGLEERAIATRRLAQDLLAAYRRLATDGGSFDPDLVRRAEALGLTLHREAP